ncbi:MAG: peptidase M61 [Cyclobacteriaceae bacterium]
MKFIVLFLSASSLLAQANGDKFIGSIDLNNVVDDKLYVTVELPEITHESIEYHIPKIVPGTYSISDFGRFITELEVVDDNGEKLAVERLTDNRWLIKDATKAKSISYWVEDTYDTKKGNVIFEPAGTNIEEGENFILNTFGFFGYLEGLKNLGYQVNITHPESLYGGTSMIDLDESTTVDTFEVSDYYTLADSPIMYSKPDTTIKNVGGAEILVQIHSKRDRVTSKDVMDNIAELLEAQKNYLGGTLPIKKYAFLIYLSDGLSRSGGFGALEHSLSSVYSFPEINPIFLSQSIRDVAAHEFFHIITPLNIHSEEIGNFDFINPNMSKHLWLYEGITEYSASHVQIKEGLISLESYMNILEGKIENSKNYNDVLPFTELSSLCLDEHKSQYQNVYQKGALIGMSLDIYLRKYSDGEYGVQQLMQDLAKEYGKEVSFKDELLFDKIAALSSAEILDFFKTYVEGPNPIPYKEVLQQVGIEYIEEGTIFQLTLGNISLGVDPDTRQVAITGTSEMNDFGKEMAYQIGDKLKSFNGTEVTTENIADLVAEFRNTFNAGDKVKMEVKRSVNGKSKKVKLKAPAQTIETEVEGEIRVNRNATDEQVKLRKAWIGV